MNSVAVEGKLKFRPILQMAPAPELEKIIVLEKWRTLFYRLGLVSEYSGHLSSRIEKKSKAFIINGEQTGHLPILKAYHYTKVIDCHLKKGSVSAQGPMAPPCESLIHYEIFQANPLIRFIFQIPYLSHLNLCQDKKNQLIQGLDEEFTKKNSGLMIIKGYENSLFSYASTAQDAGKNILDFYRNHGLRK